MSVTLADLIASARLRTNTVNSGFFDDSSELPLYVNDAVSDVYDRVVAAYAEYFNKNAEFTLTTSNEITLAEITDALGDPPVSDFYKELGVDYLPAGPGNDQTAITVLPIGSFLSRNAGNNWVGVGVYGPTRRYNILGDTLQILPASTNFAGTYVLHYVPNCPTLTDVVDLPVEMERWQILIALKVAVTMKLKREQPVDELLGQIQLQERRIDDMAQHRIKEGKRMVRRVGGWTSWGGWGGGQGYGGP